MDEMKPEVIHYLETELTANNFYNFMVKNMPDYTRPLRTRADLDHFREENVNIDVNKVLILSNKKQPLNEFKAISSEFRDRLVFGFVSSDAVEVQAEFEREIAVKPELVIYQSFDV